MRSDLSHKGEVNGTADRPIQCKNIPLWKTAWLKALYPAKAV